MTVDPGSGLRSKGDVRRHVIGIPAAALERVDGLLVTGISRTIADVAMSSSLSTSLPAIDAALAAGHPRAAMHREVDTSAMRTGRGRAEVAIAIGDPASGSVGESLSRAGMHVLGFERPVLQHPIDDREGLIGIVDFAWPDRRLVGEFDGVAKYVRAEFLQGRDPGAVVVAEKRREDRIRAAGWHVVRWGWAESLDLARLRDVLLGAGLRPSRL